jgi:hypothetical protein
MRLLAAHICCEEVWCSSRDWHGVPNATICAEISLRHAQPLSGCKELLDRWSKSCGELIYLPFRDEEPLQDRRVYERVAFCGEFACSRYDRKQK